MLFKLFFKTIVRSKSQINGEDEALNKTYMYQLSSYQRCQNPSSIVGFKTFVIIESCEKVTIKIEQVVMALGSGIWDFGI